MRQLVSAVAIIAFVVGCGDSDPGAGASLAQSDGTGTADSDDASDASDGVDESSGASGADAADGADSGEPESQCLEEKCNEFWEPCTESEACSDLWTCLATCSSQQCQQTCFIDASSEARQLMSRVLDCGTSSGCFGGPAPDCGNGTCEDEESAESCPQDCETENSLQACFESACPDEVSICFEDAACGQALSCVIDCGAPNCFQPCAQEAGGGLQSLLGPVRQCVNQAGCFEASGPTCGNGQCENGETEANCPQDCDDDAECGDGICGEEENQFNCPQDCAVSQMFCGDGVCDGPENEENCPEDCAGGGPSELIDCVFDACPESAEACFEDPECTDIVECALECDFDLQCAQGCFTGFPSGPVLELFQCAATSGCFEQEGPNCGNGACEDGENEFNCPEDCEQSQMFCGDGLCDGPENPQNCPEDCGEPSTECGNGQCESGESSITCPEDCEGGGLQCGDAYCGSNETATSCPEDCQASDVCLQEVCPDLYYLCIDDSDCTELNSCLSACGNNGGCQEGCFEESPGAVQEALFQLIECGQQFECFELNDTCGDGACNNGESDTTCPSDCGGPNTECGNGICEDGEDDNCPEDCEEPKGETYECLASGCDLGQCLNFNGCTNAFECMASSTTASAAETCLDSIGGPAGQVLSGVLQCGIELECWGSPPAPFCGDGTCDDGENNASCPADCAPTGPACGDGTCAPDESVQTCPIDCAPADPALCVLQTCGPELAACAANANCAPALQCVNTCDGDLTCAKACGDDLTGSTEELFLSVIICGESCFE